MTIWRMRIACWIPKATDTHSEYVIRIAVPQQQWLQEGVSVLRYTRIGCLVAYHVDELQASELLPSQGCWTQSTPVRGNLHAQTALTGRSTHLAPSTDATRPQRLSQT
jgi:hypothetical protein